MSPTELRLLCKSIVRGQVPTRNLLHLRTFLGTITPDDDVMAEHLDQAIRCVSFALSKSTTPPKEEAI